MNLFFGWLWILLGFITGMVLGLFFHDEKWLGGYGSLKRRMYRLGHISFFGLGTVNLLFAMTIHASSTSQMFPLAAWAFIVGAVTMPLCCVVMAHFPKAHMIFTLPVVSLIFAGVMTVVMAFQNISSHSNDLQVQWLQNLIHSI